MGHLNALKGRYSEGSLFRRVKDRVSEMTLMLSSEQ